MKTRNVRDRRLRRWELRYWTVARRNGMQADGFDPHGESYVAPLCVLAYAGRRPGKFRTTRQYKQDEFRAVSKARRPDFVSQFRYS